MKRLILLFCLSLMILSGCTATDQGENSTDTALEYNSTATESQSSQVSSGVTYTDPSAELSRANATEEAIQHEEATLARLLSSFEANQTVRNWSIRSEPAVNILQQNSSSYLIRVSAKYQFYPGNNSDNLGSGLQTRRSRSIYRVTADSVVTQAGYRHCKSQEDCTYPEPPASLTNRTAKIQALSYEEAHVHEERANWTVPWSIQSWWTDDARVVGRDADSALVHASVPIFWVTDWGPGFYNSSAYYTISETRINRIPEQLETISCYRDGENSPCPYPKPPQFVHNITAQAVAMQYERAHIYEKYNEKSDFGFYSSGSHFEFNVSVLNETEEGIRVSVTVPYAYKSTDDVYNHEASNAVYVVSDDEIEVLQRADT